MLFISGHLPSDDIPEAGQKICRNNLLDYSIRSGLDVSLVALVNEREAKYVDLTDFSFCRYVGIISVTKYSRILNLIKHPFLPIDVAVRYDSKLIDTVKERLILQNEPVLHIEYEQTACVLFELGVKVFSTVVFHDVVSQSIQRRYLNLSRFSLRYWFWRWQYGLAIVWESKLSRLISRSIVLSEKDKVLLLERGFPEDRISVVKPNISEVFYSVKRNSVQAGAIVFWGAMNRSENEDAVIWFVDEIFKKILFVRPDAVLYIVGANPSDKVLSKVSENVVVTGFVDSPVDYFERASVVVAPLRYGAGVKLKVLEALAARVPVVGTSVAAEGISEDAGILHVVDDPEEFASITLKLI